MAKINTSIHKMKDRTSFLHRATCEETKKPVDISEEPLAELWVARPVPATDQGKDRRVSPRKRKKKQTRDKSLDNFLDFIP